ncbi:MAG TPA: excinuclease ABC subunit UvrA [Pirellulales bacterium]|jgi:excinuclease ABC subunit A|nr:excinuclease ABC subunit UvrA [Pirellulales bacterium]
MSNGQPSASGAAAAAAAEPEAIRIRGARVHNLQNVDVDIPRDRLVVITGPSGSGKSSLAFDTLYAEGQRQYIESLSVYARQFLHQMERPDVDSIEGLQPTISVDQRAGSQNPRSTVATVTEIYDYLRLLMARLGEAHCPRCDAPICQQSPEQIVVDLLAMPAGTKAIIMAPLVRGRKGEHKETLATVRREGFVRARVDGEVFDVEKVPPLAARKNHTIEAVVDRVVIRPGLESRLTESIELAIRHGEGAVVVSYLPPATAEQPAPAWKENLFSTLHACPDCKLSFEELEPRSFSFNSPYGACPECEGLGYRVTFDPELVIPDPELSLADGAIAPWKGSSGGLGSRHRQELADFVETAGVDWSTPLAEWKPKARQQLWEGNGKSFLGLATLLEKQYVTETDAARHERLETFRGNVVCPACGGARLRPEARACRLAGKAIHEITALTVGGARAFFASLEFAPADQAIGQPLATEIGKRLDFLDKVGVEYLTLDRPADTLSGGELQRVRLATSIGSGLVGVCYVLDEPSIGLHPRDNQRLIDALRDLESQGNTVVVVEHDEAMMRSADTLIDIGPAAGRGGGRIVAQGTPADVIADPHSITGRYLSGQLAIPVPTARRRGTKTYSLVLEGATTNNLKDVEARIPLGVFVAVTGVSGSGKSSLINETLARALARRLGQIAPKPGAHRSLRGASNIDKLIEIDQSPIGRTPRSNPATYTGVFDEIRKVFADTREARQRGYRTGRFSFNTKGGRCEECQGQGVQRIEMNFLPDLTVPCPVCGGARFNRQTLEVHYRGRSIAAVLDMTVAEALEFFENFPHIVRLLGSLQLVGLDYLTLGQSSTTLSGGEAQRIKLATELARVDTGKTLYILDEPTTGLHFDDIRQLLAVLNRLVDRGNTVLVIEHNLDVIKSADWIIDLGPEGGEAGGRITAFGTPEEIAALPDNATGRFLKPALAAAATRSP